MQYEDYYREQQDERKVKYMQALLSLIKDGYDPDTLTMEDIERVINEEQDAKV